MTNYTKVRSITDAIGAAVDWVGADIMNLSDKRDTTLNIFKQAATDLDNINCELRDRYSKLDELKAFIEDKQSTTSQMIEDNNKVRQRILEIIGE